MAKVTLDCKVEGDESFVELLKKDYTEEELKDPELIPRLLRRFNTWYHLATYEEGEEEAVLKAISEKKG